MKKKQFFLSSLLLIALGLTACQIGGGDSNKQSDGSQATPSETSQGGGGEGSQGGGDSSTQDPTSESSSQAPAGVPGEFTFNDTELNTVQDIHTADQNKYLSLQKEYYKITGSDLSSCNANGNSNVSSPLPVNVNFTYGVPEGKTLSKYTLTFGQKADLSDGFEVSGSKDPKFSFYNAFLGTNYFKVTANFSDGSKQESDIKTLKVTETAPRNLLVGNMPNCRDMGGRTTYAGGKIKQGLIYRTSGSKFDNRTDSNQDAKDVLTKQLKVKTEINVANSTGNNVNLSGVKLENCYMAYGAVPYSNLARNSTRVRQVMDILADETNYPVFYHCRIGTDRTGITGMMIGGLLGIPFNEVFQDYCFSNFAPIDGQRYPNKASDPNGDDPAKYIDEILALPGANFQEQTYLALRLLGVPAAKLDKIIDIMTEGTKASIPQTAKIGDADNLTSSASKKTSSDYKSPAAYYGVSSNGTVSFTTDTTAGKKDVIVYLGYTGSVNNSNSTKLASQLTLKIDGAEKTISNTKNLWTAGFGSTQQDSRIGYMFNVLGNYDFTEGNHTIEITVKSGTYNIATIGVADHAA